MIDLKKVKIPGVNVPSYWVNWIYDNSGIIVENQPLQSFIENKPSIFVTEEKEIMAQHNYENFWTKRKLSYIYNTYTTLKKCFDENLVQKIYKNLNF